MESFGGPLCFVNIALGVICGLWFGCGWLGALPCMLEVAVFGAGHKLFPAPRSWLEVFWEAEYWLLSTSAAIPQSTTLLSVPPAPAALHMAV